MQMKDEPEVEEEEEDEEEEEKAKEEHEERVEDGDVRLPQEPELEAAAEHPSAPSEPSCSKETKSHGSVYFPVLASQAVVFIVVELKKQNRLCLLLQRIRVYVCTCENSRVSSF